YVSWDIELEHWEDDERDQPDFYRVQEGFFIRISSITRELENVEAALRSLERERELHPNAAAITVQNIARHRCSGELTEDSKDYTYDNQYLHTPNGIVLIQ
ncbi:hypothetical protein BGW42_005830, partial [Actinomortierella wolfii]